VATMQPRPLLRRALGAALLLSLVAAPSLISTSWMVDSNAGASAPASLAPSVRHIPMSASTCSDAICIFVVGSGLNVSNWSTTAYISKNQCSTAKFLVDGIEVASGVRTCGSAGDELESVWSDPGNFPNGTQLCNTWTGISGKPCATVHS
jgi:hypothetical protein